MTGSRRLLSVPLSIALHALVLGALVVLLRQGVPAPLFVDLTRDWADARSAGGPGAGNLAASAAPPRTGASALTRKSASDRPPSGSAPGPAKVAPPASFASAAANAGSPASSAPAPPSRDTPPSPSSAPPPTPNTPAPPSMAAAPTPAVPAQADAGSSPAATIVTSVPEGATAGAASKIDGGGPTALVLPGASEAAGRGQTSGGAAGGTGRVVTSDAGSAPGRGGGLGAGALARAAPGDGQGGGAADYTRYLSVIRQRIQESLQYPASARRRGLSGTVHLEIEVAPSGVIARVAVIASSSHRLLDEAALEAARALPRIPFPGDLSPRALRARLPIVFELR